MFPMVGELPANGPRPAMKKTLKAIKHLVDANTLATKARPQ